MTKKEYWYWLCHIDGLGSVRIKKLLDYFEEPEGISGEAKRRWKHVKSCRRVWWKAGILQKKMHTR